MPSDAGHYFQLLKLALEYNHINVLIVCALATDLTFMNSKTCTDVLWLFAHSIANFEI